jgi:hypothetical protein
MSTRKKSINLSDTELEGAFRCHPSDALFGEALQRERILCCPLQTMGGIFISLHHVRVNLIPNLEIRQKYWGLEFLPSTTIVHAYYETLSAGNIAFEMIASCFSVFEGTLGIETRGTPEWNSTEKGRTLSR